MGADSSCTFCGQCANVCPTGAIVGNNKVANVWKALHDATKTVIVRTALAVRVAVGQEYGFKVGQPVTGKNPEGDKINYRAVRGLDGVKEAKVEVAPGVSVNVAIASGLGNARKVLDMVRADRNRWFRLQRQCLAAGDCAHDE